MARIKLVLADMDGTLVPFGGQGVSRRTISAIHALREAGIVFGPSSGRERASILEFFHGDESCVQIGITSNGKVVLFDGQIVSFRPLPREPLERLLAAVRQVPGMVFVCYPPLDQALWRPDVLCPIAATDDELQELLAGPGEQYAAPLDELPKGDITTVALIVPGGRTLATEERNLLASACPELDLVQPAPFVFDVLPKGWSKLAALPVLQETLGVEIDEIAYFGDSQNDLTMMAAIPNSFCMGNGTDEAKAAARWVIDTDANDGAAKVMESLAAHGGALVPEEW